jgi:hypothetical protein
MTFPTERERSQAALLKLKAARCDPSTDAGLLALSRSGDAHRPRESDSGHSVSAGIDRAGSSSLYGQMARLGLAEADYGQAIDQGDQHVQG